MRKFLPSWAWDSPVTLVMLLLAAMVTGLIATWRIPLQLFPSGFEPKYLWVGVPYRNGSPLETDEAVIRPITDQLGTVAGLKSIESNATEGQASLDLEFHSSVGMDEAYDQVVDRLERAMADLPPEVDRYWVYKYNPTDDPVIWAGISLPDDLSDPYATLDKVVRARLERIPGVASLDIWGVPQKKALVLWDRDALQSHNTNLAVLQRTLMADNFQAPAGRIVEDGRVMNVRSLSTLTDLFALERYPVGDGVVLSDVAEVQVGGLASRTISRIDGRKAAALGVRKEATANTVEVCEGIHAALAELEADPRLHGAKFHVFFDQGKLIEGGVEELVRASIEGGIFAVIILYVFLRELRMTLLIATSIPVSLLVTVAIQYLRGGSLNLLCLMGLMLSVGMVVDNAIVVVEAIYRRRAAGEAARTAAVEGTAEVNLAIILSTLTSAVVFLPVILMSGDARFSFFMGEIGFPVVITHFAALVVAILYAPLATRYVGAAEIRPDPRWLQWISRKYTALLHTVLRYRFESAHALLAITLLTIIPVKGVSCVSEEDGNLGNFGIEFTVPPQASQAERNAIVERFERLVDEHREAWGVRVSRARLSDGSFEGELDIYLMDDGPMSRDDVIAAASKVLPTDIPGVEAHVGWGSGNGGNSRSIKFQLHGEDMRTLDDLGREAVRRLETVPGVLDAKLGFSSGGLEELQLRVDREMTGRFGLRAADVGQTISFAMRGASLQPIRGRGSPIEVETRFRDEDRAHLEDLMDFPLFSAVGMVPLRSVVDVVPAQGPAAIRRNNRSMAITITADLAEGLDFQAIWPKADAVLRQMDLPLGYSFDAGDAMFQQEETSQSMWLAVTLSICFVFLIMGTLFESFILPLSIITTVPMALVGTFWGLYVSGTPFDTMSGIGLVILVGIVVNNGIVLVDRIRQRHESGQEREAAIVAAADERLRPILMTALCTVIGLVPMAAGSSTFIGLPYAPLGRTVMSGMIASTVLTLLFVPFLYSVLDDLRTFFTGLVRTNWRSRT